ncbi:hypothetical protein BKP35_07930 [Anaerobacillus arseniciselenatis]|uniref:Metallo-beta-lactamase domain-containing protein n=1 Tax=Anaerobacillus arseniciselenatis TaxID=85682 RepID=A0A1S2LNK6_9BACI|nr:MBL fold metallo-hydrolase [Anaerobacillus arseniciselenatis]OIJ14119.1 hypothetical protein BKP35_07930 [Anaerobacillus arseniciselenatis]
MLNKTKCLEKLNLPTPFIVGPVNIYLIKGDALTLVDTGPKTKEATEVLVEALKQHGYSVNDIDQIILTHHHPDHAGLIEDVFPNATVIGHKKCQPWLKKEKHFLTFVENYIAKFYSEHGVSDEIVDEMVTKNRYYLSFTGNRGLDINVCEGDKIDGVQGWTVIETPGHAQSHISLYNEKDGLLIGGDHIIEHISSNALLEPPYVKGESRPQTLLQYRDSLQKCLNLNIRKVFSGHGKNVENIEVLLNKRFQEQEEKAKRLKLMLPKEGITSFDLCKSYFAHIYKKEPTLTMSEIIGHLDLLEDRKIIETVNSNGKTFYTCKGN